MTRFRIAVRLLMKAPLVTAIAVLSLALGIGGTVAIFSVSYAVLMRSLPVEEPGRLVKFSGPGPKGGTTTCNQTGSCDEIFSYPMFRDLEAEQTVFTGIAAHRSLNTNLAYQGQTLNGTGMLVSGSYFPVLSIRPALGRLLDSRDDRTVGESPVVVLSHAYWRTHFGASPDVLNTTLVVNGQALTIVGVAPEGFDGATMGIRPEVYVPITMQGVRPRFDGYESRRVYWAYLFARLSPGVSIEQAEVAVNIPYRAILNEVEAPLQQMGPQRLEQFRNKRIVVEEAWRGQSSLHEEAETPLLFLSCVMVFVLLIACANVANLLTVRGVARTGEMSVRISLGARRVQLVAQLLGESLLIAVLGGLGGLFVARWTLDLIVSLLPPEDVGNLPIGLDAPALLFAAALTLGTSVLFGLFPALQTTRPDVASGLKGQAGHTIGTGNRFRSAMVTGQIALSMALLVSSGLFVRSLYNLGQVDLGFEPERLTTFGVSPELNGYSPVQSRALFERIEIQLAEVPGVTGASASMVRLLSGSNWGSNVNVQGFDAGPDDDTHALYNRIGPGYFKALGVPLISGREFTAADAGTDSSQVVIVNEAFSQKFNLGRDAVGKRMRIGGGNDLNMEIVGLVPNTKYSEVRDDIPPQFFMPYRQDESLGAIAFLVRSTLDSDQLLPTIPPLVSRLDPNLPVEGMRTMTAQVRESIAAERLVGTLAAAFAVLATLLAAVGLYGLVAYSVQQRTKEIGLRLALGAERSHVRGLIFRQVGFLTLLGTLAGLGISLGLGRIVQSMLFEINGYDPAVLVSATALLAAVALCASSVPTYRASNVDPMAALRYE